MKTIDEILAGNATRQDIDWNDDAQIAAWNVGRAARQAAADAENKAANDAEYARLSATQRSLRAETLIRKLGGIYDWQGMLQGLYELSLLLPDIKAAKRRLQSNPKYAFLKGWKLYTQDFGDGQSNYWLGHK